MNLEELKNWLRIDDVIDEDLIVGLHIAAEQYLRNAGVLVDYNSELYKLAIKLLVTHWYENREPTGKADKLEFSLNSIITQLKYCQSNVNSGDSE
ncbi:MAG: head-tail connector protein [Tissierellales bacterium]